MLSCVSPKPDWTPVRCKQRSVCCFDSLGMITRYSIHVRCCYPHLTFEGRLVFSMNLYEICKVMKDPVPFGNEMLPRGCAVGSDIQERWGDIPPSKRSGEPPLFSFSVFVFLFGAVVLVYVVSPIFRSLWSALACGLLFHASFGKDIILLSASVLKF